MLKKENGVSLVEVILTVLLIIGAIFLIRYAINAIFKDDLEEMKTNMITIEAKVREYVENASYDLGSDANNVTDEMKETAFSELQGDDKGILVTMDDELASKLLEIGISQEDIENQKVYKLSTEILENMGISGVESNDEDGWYIVVYDIENTSAEVYHTVGIDGVYSLSELKEVES